MHFRVFFNSNVQNGEYVFSCKNLDIFFLGGGWGGLLEIPDFFFFFFLFFGGGGGDGRCWARAYIWRKNESIA